MNPHYVWPEWLESARIADTSLEEAYEQTPARLRSLLKAGIALSCFHYGSSPSLEVSERTNSHAGYWQKIVNKPVDWACLFFDGAESAAAFICASAMLPVLANVPSIFAVSCGNPGSRLLVSLELCGIEDLFILEPDQCGALIGELCGQYWGAGRICTLNCEFPQLTMYSPQNSPVPLASLKSPERLLLKSPAAFSKDDLEFCLGRVPPTQMEGSAQCIYVEAPAADGKSADLKLGPGCEGFWLFSPPGTAFYQQSCFCFGETGQTSRPF